MTFPDEFEILKKSGIQPQTARNLITLINEGGEPKMRRILRKFYAIAKILM